MDRVGHSGSGDAGSRLCVGLLARCFRSRRRLLLINLALRQQLVVLKRRQARPTLLPFDKLFFWVLACRFWSDWIESLLVVTPEPWSAGIVLGFDCTESDLEGEKTDR